MTDEEMDHEKAWLLLEFEKAKQTAAALRQKRERLAAAVETVASHIRGTSGGRVGPMPQQSDVEGVMVLQPVRDLLAESSAADERVKELRARKLEFGFPE